MFRQSGDLVKKSWQVFLGRKGKTAEEKFMSAVNQMFRDFNLSGDLFYVFVHFIS
jgi:hypothetical protein